MRYLFRIVITFSSLIRNVAVGFSESVQVGNTCFHFNENNAVNACIYILKHLPKSREDDFENDQISSEEEVQDLLLQDTI